MSLCNESPRHLAKQDKWEEAINVLSRIRALPPDHPYVAAEFADIKSSIEDETRSSMMTGTNAINYYASQIFATLGVESTENELFATGIYGLVKLIAVLVFLIFVADSLGRRKSLLWTGIGQALTMLYVGVFVAVAKPQDQEGGQVTPAGYVALIATTRLRATNVSFAAATQWLFNFIVSRAVPPMLETMGTGGFGTYIFFRGWCLVMTAFVWFFIPETKGLSLEAMNHVFGFQEDIKNKRIDTENASVKNELQNGGESQAQHSGNSVHRV
ncbi:unnamed protein product [Colletotrichum noveboracense]|uniref:Major facilitator superfamily (MFS) profile domain-containing protein n=1 Tax=Colletotrichum noveboracense TaxID=2664923 RepID=A0A9W4WEM6_9PEZI|nr:unnamed protein product [Colletotrichum noveboracense]